MKDLHAILGIASLAAYALAAGWGGIAWMRAIPAASFWYVLRAAQALVAVEVVVGGVELAAGRRPPDTLHYVYGVAPLVVSLVTEAMRVGATHTELQRVGAPLDSLERREQVLLARRIVLREIGIMTVGALLIITLLLRAEQSGGAF